MRKGCLRYWERSAFEAEIVAQGATVLPSLVKAVLLDVLSSHEETALSKTPKPRHPEFRLLLRATLLP